MDDLTLVQALYRASSYLDDYSAVLDSPHTSAIRANVRQSSTQLKQIAELITNIQRNLNKLIKNHEDTEDINL